MSQIQSTLVLTERVDQPKAEAIHPLDGPLWIAVDIAIMVALFVFLS